MNRLVPILLATLTSACNVLDDFTVLDGGEREDAGASDTGTTWDAGEVHLSLVPADILFVVDSSGSMGDEQANLAANFDRFAAEVAGTGSYRLAIVSTDVDSSTGQRTGTRRYTSNPSYPFEVDIYEVEDNCAPAGIEHGCFRGPDPARRVITSSLSRSEQIAAFEADISLGTCGSGSERGLDAMLLALEKATGGGCNEGFLRPYANLVIVFVTDEDDASSGPIAQYVERLGELKPFWQVRIAVIGGVAGGESSRCSTGQGAACGTLCNDPPPPAGSGASCTSSPACPSSDEVCVGQHCTSRAAQFWDYCYWCSYYSAPDCCSALPSNRYVDFARAVEERVAQVRVDFPIKHCTGLGSRVSCLVDTICQEAFGDTLVRIARELVLVD